VQHRDIKAAHVLLVLLDGALTAKLSDFGTAKLKMGGVTTTRNYKGGTHAHKAPETFDDRFYEASDVWSFFMLLYEIATWAVRILSSSLMVEEEEDRLTRNQRCRTKD
jgi:serine/threonine protein kinase